MRRKGPLQFCVSNDIDKAVFDVVLTDGGARYPQREGPRATVIIGNKETGLSEFFGDDFVQIDFGDGSLLIYNHLYFCAGLPDLAPFDVAKLEAWDWSRANIRARGSGN